MLNRAVYLLKAKDSFAAVEYMAELGDPAEVAANYSELVRLLYWQEHDVPAMISMARAGIQYCLSFSVPEMRGYGKTIAYNLASFTWPGWDEPGIKLSPADILTGLDAAKLNVRLANELNKPNIAKSRAHWMLGAHWMAQHELDKARHHFYRAAIYANRDGDHEDEMLLARAYAMLTKRAEAEVKEVLEQVKSHEHGAGMVEQLRTAQRVFKLWLDDDKTQSAASTDKTRVEQNASPATPNQKDGSDSA